MPLISTHSTTAQLEHTTAAYNAVKDLALTSSELHVSGNAFKILCYLHSLAWISRKHISCAFASERDLAVRLHLARKTVRSSLRELMSKGYIERLDFTVRQKPVWRMLNPAENGAENEQGSGVKSSPEVGQKVVQFSARNGVKSSPVLKEAKGYKETIDKQEITVPAAAAEGSLKIDSSFSETTFPNLPENELSTERQKWETDGAARLTNDGWLCMMESRDKRHVMQEIDWSDWERGADAKTGLGYRCARSDCRSKVWLK